MSEYDSQNMPEETRKRKKNIAHGNFTRLEPGKHDSQTLGDENASPTPPQLNNEIPSSKYTEFRNTTDTKLDTDKLPETDNGNLGRRTDELGRRTDELGRRTDELREKSKATKELSDESDAKPNETKSIEQVIKEVQEDPDHSDKFKENVLKLIFYWKEAQEDSEKKKDSEN
jgi:hypothetical protein